MASKVLNGIVRVLKVPSMVVVGLLALVVWLLLTLTGVGPLIHWLCTKRDRRLLQQVREEPSLQYRWVDSPRGYRLAYRLLDRKSTPVDTAAKSQVASWGLCGTDVDSACPIVIPNALMSTMFTTNKMQELLHAAGFTVLTYDRFGVGLSDPNTTGQVPTVDDVVDDLFLLMDHAVPQADKWIFLGPSMGSIIAQAFMTRHPEKCAALLNLDGFPHPFAARRENFVGYARFYKLVSKVHWTGVVRFFMLFADGFAKQYATSTTSTQQILAQMNQKNFVSNIPIEMQVVVDLAQAVSDSWGPLNALHLSSDELLLLLQLPPTNNGEMDAHSGEWKTLPRSINERGDDWVDLQDPLTQQALAALHNKRKESKLGQVMSKLVVYVLGARTYMESQFDQQMRDWSGAEQALHQYMALHGKRFVFPKLDHSKMLLLFREITWCAVEIRSSSTQRVKIQPCDLLDPVCSSSGSFV